jgi:hypothetical protein
MALKAVKLKRERYYEHSILGILVSNNLSGTVGFFQLTDRNVVYFCQSQLICGVSELFYRDLCRLFVF